MRFVPVFFFILFFTTAARAQMTCSSRPISPASVRAEGYTELLGDLTIICTGGIPTASGVPVPSADITVTLNVPVTNRKNATDNFIDALLLIDEPHSRANPNIPLTLCGASGVDCNITGTGTGVGVYSGASNRPNVFQGELTGTSTVRFRLPVDPPGGGSGQRIFRIVNLRGDATKKAGQIPNTITASAAIPGGSSVPETIVGIVHPGLTITDPAVRVVPAIPAQISACTPQNIAWAQAPEGDLPPQRNEDKWISLQEGSPGAWRGRNIAQSLAAGRYGGFVSGTLGNLNQNIVGYAYATETGFFNGASTDPGAPVPSIPTTAAFPAIRGAERAGAADFGTRILVRFSNIPSQVDIYLPVETPLLADFARTGSAVMVQSDGQGGMQRVTGGARYGLAKLQKAGDTATAFYEVVNSDSLLTENLAVPIFLVFGQTLGGSAPIRLTAGLAPALGASSPDATSVIPRFSGDTVSEDAFAFWGYGCGSPDLSVGISVTSVSGQSGSLTLAANNDGTVNSSGLVTMRATLPQGLTATSIGGSGWTCALANLTCTTSQPIPPGQYAFPSVTLQFQVAAGTPDKVTVSATISGGGDPYGSNNTTTAEIAIQSSSDKQVTLWTQPPGLVYTVDGVYHQGGRKLNAKTSQTLQIAAIPNQVTPAGLPAAFASWSDGGALSHGISVQATNSPVIANFDSTPQSMTCENYSIAPLVRNSGLAEPLTSMTLRCKGGTPSPVGQPAPKVDIRLTLNLPVGSRIVSPGYSEALLLIDEPHSFLHSNVPFLPCGAAGSNDNGSGQCPATAAGTATYDGTSGHPNVFQGQPEGANTLIWKAVPFDPPGPGGERILRFVNIRANATSLPSVPPRMVPPTVAGEISFDPPIAARSIPSNSWKLAFGQSAIVDPASPYSGVSVAYKALNGCLAANPSIYSDPSKPLESGGQNGFQFGVSAIEGFPSAFAAKSWSVKFANQRPAPVSYPPDVQQAIPDAYWSTETDFFAGTSLTPNPSPLNLNNLPPPPPAPAFPSVRGLEVAGKVDSGSRVFFRFTGIPAGVKLFVPIRLDVMASLTGYFSLAQAALLSTNGANGAGAFQQATGNASGLAPLAINGNEALAVYEVLGGDHFTLEYLPVSIAVSFPGIPIEAGGQIRIQAGFAPWHTASYGDATSPVPRFAAPAPASNILGIIDITPCGLVLDKKSLSFQTTAGQDPAPQTIAVSHLSNPAFTWGTVKDGSWLSVSPSSGTGAGTITVRAAASGLAAGTYTGNISVTSPGSVTQTVLVQLTVASATQPPSYTSLVDQVGCSIISGWAADRNQLNTSISVDILEGSTLLGAVLADGFRSDVATYLGDSGAHAFTWVTPTALKDGRDHAITVRPSGSTTTLGGAQNLRCTAP